MLPDVAEWCRVWRLLDAAERQRPLTDSEQSLQRTLRITLRKHFIPGDIKL